MGSRMSHDEAPDTDRDLNLYDARLLQILRIPLPLAPGKNMIGTCGGWPMIETALARLSS
jgi:hypothetical protein